MISHESEKKSVPVYGDGVKDVHKQILVGPRDGFTGYLREFTLAPGGHTPYHRHNWHHVVYVLEGTGLLTFEDKKHSIKTGSVAYIEGNKTHGLTNTGNTQMRFLCLVPEEGDSYQED